ncbi:MAG: hypothetical protein H0X24_20575 [Ktedonobacterales bacterium]|nr:hypothetical protein [Ktedonobacterales bacterium]
MAPTLYPLLEEVANGFGMAFGVLRQRSTEPMVTPPLLLQFRAGHAESPGWLLIQAQEFAPTPLTVALFRQRDVYGAPRLIRALLDVLVTEGWFVDVAPEAYALAPLGRDILERSQLRRAALLAQLAPSLTVDLARLAALLQRVSTASLRDATLFDPWCFAHSRQRAPAVAAPPILQLFHFGDDFNALRDDAHMAAWQPLGIPGAAWEAFAFVCAGQATSAADLMPHLAQRGYTQPEYAALLDDVAARGWLQHTAEGFAVTALGRQVRSQVEQQTDHYFAAPWGVLSSDEYHLTETLLTQLRDELNGVASQSASS